jgi:alkanesulfonate monooxygenase SsuD/methylene tetrahydromethanopterin reductase-like flavin-dependent oxidoreductase (luciferase family)
VRLSVLDQSVVSSGCPPAKAIRDTATLAQACDGFGYHRFWVAEHHGYDGLAGSAPEVLAAALAVATRRIRIGSAAKILPHSSYCFAHFLADGEGGEEAVEAYRASFAPGPFRDTPNLAVCAFALAAPSEAKAEALFLAYARWRMARDARRFVALGPPCEEPSALGADVEALRARSMFGPSDTVVAGLRRLLNAYDADEIVIQVPAHALHDRITACRLIAEAAAADDLPEAWLAGGASGLRLAEEMSKESSQ